jgi:hypothetical protein
VNAYEALPCKLPVNPRVDTVDPVTVKPLTNSNDPVKYDDVTAYDAVSAYEAETLGEPGA